MDGRERISEMLDYKCSVTLQFDLSILLTKIVLYRIAGPVWPFLCVTLDISFIWVGFFYLKYGKSTWERKLNLRMAGWQEERDYACIHLKLAKAYLCVF